MRENHTSGSEQGVPGNRHSYCDTPSHQTTHFGSPPLCFLAHATGHLCYDARAAMMHARTSTETAHQATQIESGL